MLNIRKSFLDVRQGSEYSAGKWPRLWFTYQTVLLQFIFLHLYIFVQNNNLLNKKPFGHMAKKFFISNVKNCLFILYASLLGMKPCNILCVLLIFARLLAFFLSRDEVNKNICKHKSVSSKSVLYKFFAPCNFWHGDSNSFIFIEIFMIEKIILSPPPTSGGEVN